MKFVVLLALLFIPSVLVAQYNMYQISTTCISENTEDFQSIKNHIDSVMFRMMENDQLYMYTFNERVRDDSISFDIMVSAESDEQFAGVVGEWEKQIEKQQLDKFTAMCPSRKDGLAFKWDHYYPMLKVKWAAVRRPAHIDYTPDPDTKYNIVIDFLAYSELEEQEKMDSSAVNWGLTQIARLINLHVAAGIPAENIHVVAAVHGYAGRSFLTDEAYNKRYKISNPNTRVINQLADVGVDFLVCAQSLGNITREELSPQAKISLTAQTVITEFQLKGYALKSFIND